MQKLKCELCGATEFIRTDEGLFKCKYCGCSYTLEQAQKIIHVGDGPAMGNAELERLLKNAGIFIDQKRYADAYQVYRKITDEYPDKSSGWFGLVEVAMLQIFDTGCIGIEGTLKDPLNGYGLGTWYKTALQYADAADGKRYQQFWNDCWVKIDHGIHSGELTFQTPEWRFEECLNAFADSSPIGENLVREGKANAGLLMNHGVRWGVIDRQSTCGWLPYRPIGEGKNWCLYFVLGRMIKFYDPVGYSDYSNWFQCLPELIALDEASIVRYQKEAKANGKALAKRNICPYCGNSMKSSLFGKRCMYCQNTF